MDSDPLSARPAAWQLVLAWVVLLASVAGCWLARPGLTAHGWNQLQTLVLFAGGKAATLIALTRAQWRDLGPWRLIAYLVWPALQPRLFGRSHRPQPDDIVPTVRDLVFNATAGVLLLWVVPRFFPDDAPLLLRAWTGLVGTVLLSLFVFFDLWVIFYRELGIGVEKLWFDVSRPVSLSDFWGRHWNRIFSGMVRELLFNPLYRRVGVPAAM